MSDRGLAWYKRDPIRFMDGVQGLGPDVIGAYAILLDLIYARGGETRRDDRHLSGILGCSVRKATALTDHLIEVGKIEVDGDFITNSVAKTNAKSSRNLSETRANAGRKGGENGTGDSKNRYLAQAKAQANASIDKIREDKSNPLTPFEILSAVASPDVARDFVAHRAGIKKPLSELAAERMAEKLRAHPDPDAVLNHTIENGWQGIFPDKVEGKAKSGAVNFGAFGKGEMIR